MGAAWVPSVELGAEHLPEEPVQPIPLVTAVERDQEEVRPRKRRQRLRRPRPAEHGVAQVARHPVEDGDVEQELLLLERLPAEELEPEVVGDEAVDARVRRLEHVVDGRLSGERDEVEARDPALAGRVERAAPPRDAP